VRYSNGKVIKASCSKARAGLVGEKKAGQATGGRRRGRETEKDCLRREIREELPKLKLGRLKLWKEVKSKNPRSRRKRHGADLAVQSKDARG
jgi:hypothetical protein